MKRLLPTDGFITVADAKLEYKYIPQPLVDGTIPNSALNLVLLHEGLGCVAMWRTFPERLSEVANHSVFLYSRSGYGGSSACGLPRPLDYMTQEATQTLPQILSAVPGEQYILIGHSDGASICALYAGMVNNPKVSGIVLIAPHFYTEQIAINAIRKAKEAFDNQDLRDRLARYHGENTDCAFRGWNDSWLAPGFRQWDIRPLLSGIRVPVLAIQGDRDRYGTLEQLGVIEKQCPNHVEVVVLPDCDHSPHIERPEELIQLISDFSNRCINH